MTEAERALLLAVAEELSRLGRMTTHGWPRRLDDLAAAVRAEAEREQYSGEWAK